jgi:uncharacterized protein (TIRG00374 family)
LNSQTKRYFYNFVKYLIGITLITIILRKVDLRELLDTVNRSNFIFVFISTFVFGLASISLGLRLHVLLQKFGFNLPTSLKILFISIFLNNVTTSVLGDAYKLVIFRKRMASYKSSISILLLERGIGFAVVFFMLMAYFFIAHGEIFSLLKEFDFNLRIFNPVILVVLGITLIISILFVKKYYLRLIHYFRDFIKVFKDTSIGLTFPKYFSLTVWTIISQLLITLHIYLLIKSLSENILILDVLFVVILTFIAAYIPVSVGSLGIREGVTIIGLSFYGISVPAATAVAFMSRIIIYLYSALGGILFILFKRQTVLPMQEVDQSPTL